MITRHIRRPVMPSPPVLSVDELPVLCTASDAARLLRHTAAYIVRLCGRGTIPAYKEGNTWLIRRDDLLSYVASRFSPQEAAR